MLKRLGQPGIQIYLDPQKDGEKKTICQLKQWLAKWALSEWVNPCTVILLAQAEGPCH